MSAHQRELQRLRGIIDDPRYWRDKDPALIEEVQQGFARLFPGGGKAAGDDASLAARGQAANVMGFNGEEMAEAIFLAHVSPNQIVVPEEFQTDEVMTALEAAMGRELERFTVGSGEERRNPASGLRAFGFDEDADETMSARIVERMVDSVGLDQARRILEEADQGA
jgi:hypothetical protein